MTRAAERWKARVSCAAPRAAERRPRALRTMRRALGAALVMAASAPGIVAAQLSEAGFVPSLVPASVRQAPVANAGYARWLHAGGPAGRLDVWFGRAGAALSLGTVHAAGETAVHAGGAAMVEVLPQGVGLRAPGVQVQAGYSAISQDGERTWSVPITAGVFLHVPPPLFGRAHGLLHPALSVRHVVAGSERGTSAGLSLRLVVSDGGWFTNWGAFGYARLLDDGADTGPRWEVAITRVLRRRPSHGG